MRVSFKGKTYHFIFRSEDVVHLNQILMPTVDEGGNLSGQVLLPTVVGHLRQVDHLDGRQLAITVDRLVDDAKSALAQLVQHLVALVGNDGHRLPVKGRLDGGL